jgi:hypothetical protein
MSCPACWDFRVAGVADIARVVRDRKKRSVITKKHIGLKRRNRHETKKKADADQAILAGKEIPLQSFAWKTQERFLFCWSSFDFKARKPGQGVGYLLCAFS